MQAHQSTSQDAKVVEGINALKQEWGAAYDNNLLAARAAVTHFGDDLEMSNYLDETGLGNDPKLIKYLAKVGASLGEDTIKGIGESVDGLFTPQRAKDEILNIQNNPAYVDRRHPEHNKLVSEMQKLYQMAYSS